MRNKTKRQTRKMCKKSQIGEKMPSRHSPSVAYGEILRNDIFGKSAYKLIETLHCRFRPSVIYFCFAMPRIHILRSQRVCCSFARQPSLKSVCRSPRDGLFFTTFNSFDSPSDCTRNIRRHKRVIRTSHILFWVMWLTSLDFAIGPSPSRLIRRRH